MVFRLAIQRWRRVMLVAVVVVETVWGVGILAPPQPARAAAIIHNLATSSSATLQTRWYSLRGYGAIPKADVNWPRRSDPPGCPPYMGQIYKISPWQPQNFAMGFSGDIMNQSSNCSDEFHDAGTAVNGGAWLHPDAEGGWAMPGGPQVVNWLNGSYPSASWVMNGCSDNTLVGGNANPIWGTDIAGPGLDTTDQFYATGPRGTIGGVVPGLYYQRYPAGAVNPLNLKLYSNGVTLVRDSFTMTAADLARLAQPTSKLLMQAYADDWLQIYINGVAVGAYSTSTTAQVSLDLTAVAGLLVPGTNWIGVMVADKGVFDTSDPGVRQAGVCYNLQYQYSNTVAQPAIVGDGGDIHAGGGVCGGTLESPSAGNIKGHPAAGSWGQYVSSASGSIADFKTNGTGSDTLDIGQTGGYQQICRPDLVQEAEDYYVTSTSYAMVPGADFDVTGKAGVYYFNGATLTLHGMVTNKLTVVARGAANVVISGALQLDNVAHPPRDVPSLGIIANGDIRIQASVTQVDAYLFSNSTIDTCAEATLACATLQLDIRGFLMAKNLAFHRIGPINTNGAVVTEHITLNPQIYLNPPKLFDASVDNVLVDGQGERQPLF